MAKFKVIKGKKYQEVVSKNRDGSNSHMYIKPKTMELSGGVMSLGYAHNYSIKDMEKKRLIKPSKYSNTYVLTKKGIGSYLKVRKATPKFGNVKTVIASRRRL